MSTAFFVSYVLLCALIATETWMLRALVKTAYVVNALHRDGMTQRVSTLLPGVRAPEFVVPTLIDGKQLTMRGIVGSKTVLVFVAAARVLDVPAAAFRTLIGHARVRHDGARRYLICTGTLNQCRELDERYALAEIHDGIAHDSGAVATAFAIRSAFSTVLIDENGCVEKTGSAAFGEEADAPARL